MSKKARALVVEADTPVATLMTHVLKRAGCDVQATQDGQQGMEWAQETKFDLILLGVDLPGISGLEICRELKQDTSAATPQLFLSPVMTAQRPASMVWKWGRRILLRSHLKQRISSSGSNHT